VHAAVALAVLGIALQPVAIAAARPVLPRAVGVIPVACLFLVVLGYFVALTTLVHRHTRAPVLFSDRVAHTSRRVASTAAASH
jgi:hypothetical protein